MSSPLIIESLTLAFWSPGPGEMMLLAVVALLLYGGNLPEVARTWGKTFADFRRSISGIQNELNDVIYNQPDQLAYHDDVRDDAYYADGYDEAEFATAEDHAEQEVKASGESTDMSVSNGTDGVFPTNTQQGVGEQEETKQN